MQSTFSNVTDFLYPWHRSAWQQVQQMRDRLPHAILFHGAEGTGKTHFAEGLAQSFLCESPGADKSKESFLNNLFQLRTNRYDFLCRIY